MNRGNRAYLGEFRLAVHAAGLEGVQQGGEGGGEDAQQRVARFCRERAGLRGDGEQLRDAVAEIHAFLRLLRGLRRLLRLFRSAFLADLGQRRFVQTRFFFRALRRQTRLDGRVDRLRGARRRGRLLRQGLQLLDGTGKRGNPLGGHASRRC